MKTLPDVRALDLPHPFRSALLKLVTRMLEISAAYETETLVASVFGKFITFGQLSIPSVQDWNEAIKVGSITSASVHIRELVDLLKLIMPTTPVCNACGEFAIDQVGGKQMTLEPDALCPYCLKGAVEIVPMILRTVNWVTGELVAPNIELDHHSHVGLAISLTDHAIVKWADGINMDLDEMLRSEHVSIHGLLAYMQLHEHAFVKPEGASKFLLAAPQQTDTQLIREAARFMDDREITNLPHKTFLVDGRRRDLFTPITIGDRSYLIEGKIGEGDKCDVYRALWDHEPTERVVVKIARVGVPEDRLRNELAHLSALAKSDVKGVEFFRQLLPEIISFGSVQDPNGQKRTCVVYRDRNGFDWTLEDVMRAYPQGVETQTMVWMFNRILMLLGWMHEHGLVHGALTPAHMLIHPTYHGLMFLDLAYAGYAGYLGNGWEPLHEQYRPKVPIAQNVHHPMIDICMAARSMIAVLGGDLKTRMIPTSVPETIARFLVNLAYPTDAYVWNHAKSADQIKNEFAAVVESIYGPRKYHPFVMPSV